MRAVLVGVLLSLPMVLTAQITAPPNRSVRDGVYGVEQAQRGASLYSNYCAYCHASDLQGFSPAPRAGAPALIGATFISDWRDLALRDL